MTDKRHTKYSEGVTFNDTKKSSNEQSERKPSEYERLQKKAEKLWTKANTLEGKLDSFIESEKLLKKANDTSASMQYHNAYNQSKEFIDFIKENPTKIIEIEQKWLDLRKTDNPQLQYIINLIDKQTDPFPQSIANDIEQSSDNIAYTMEPYYNTDQVQNQQSFRQKEEKSAIEFNQIINQSFSSPETPLISYPNPNTDRLSNLYIPSSRSLSFAHHWVTDRDQTSTSENSETLESKGKDKEGLEQPKERERIVFILNGLKSLQERKNISIMGKGASGLGQIRNRLSWRTTKDKPLEAMCDEIGPLIKKLRDKIVLHNTNNPWPNSAIEDLKKIETALLEKRSSNNQLVQDLQDQIKAFSDNFNTQQ